MKTADGHLASALAGVASRPTVDAVPVCGKCAAPITTGAMAMLCPHGRACEFVVDDEHWLSVEDCREVFGIVRLRLNTDTASPVGARSARSASAPAK